MSAVERFFGLVIAQVAATQAATAMQDAQAAITTATSTSRLVQSATVSVPASTIAVATRRTVTITWDTAFTDATYQIVTGIESAPSAVSTAYVGDVKVYNVTKTGCMVSYNQLLSVAADLVKIHVIARHL